MQVYLEWAQAEPARGVYNFSVIEDKLRSVAEMGKYAVLKLNGGNKPAWMYDQIPQNADVWSAENFDNTLHLIRENTGFKLKISEASPKIRLHII